MMRKRATVLFLSAMAFAMAMPASAMAQSAGNMPQQQPTREQVPQPDSGGVNWKGVGVGAGTIAGNLLYIPAKLAYGILGGIAGGAGYVLTGGNSQVSNTIWRSSLGGDYVLTPKMLTGQQPVRFSGPTQTAPPSNATSSASGSLSPVPATPSYSSSYGAGTSSNGAPGSSPPTMTSSGYGSSGYNSSSFGGSSARPMDHGTGPVRNSSSAPPLPQTNIE